MAIIRNFRLPAGIGISADYIETFGTIQSTSPATGAIVSRGGVGVGNSISIGGRLQLFSGANYTAFQAASGITSNSVYNLPATSPAIGTSILQSNSSGAMSWATLPFPGTYGGTGYTTYTKGDLIVGAGSTFIKQAVGSDGSILVANSNAGSGISWRGPIFGNFTSYTTQPVLAADTATPLTVSDADSSAGFSIMGGAGTSSRIQINEAGYYNIQFSAQLNQSTGSTPQTASIWLKKNGTDVPGSLGVITVTGHNNYTVASWNYIESFTAGQYFEFYLSSPDNHMQIEGLTGLTIPTRPDSPSFAVTVTKVI